MKQVVSFVYLGVKWNVVGGRKEEIGHRLNDNSNALGGIKEAWPKNKMSVEMKMRIYKSLAVPKVMYGNELFSLDAKDMYREEVFEMIRLRNMCGITRRDRIRNVRIR